MQNLLTSKIIEVKWYNHYQCNDASLPETLEHHCTNAKSQNKGIVLLQIK